MVEKTYSIHVPTSVSNPSQRRSQKFPVRMIPNRKELMRKMKMRRWWYLMTLIVGWIPLMMPLRTVPFSSLLKAMMTQTTWAVTAAVLMGVSVVLLVLQALPCLGQWTQCPLTLWVIESWN